jgi:SAM-dependent methyltransferase
MQGPETLKNHRQREESGFYDKWMRGYGLDIGYGKGYDTVLPTAIGIEQEQWVDGKLPILDNNYDYVYSSHCLEHINDWGNAIREFHRVLKIGGYCITIVPHMFLYEKKLQLPSLWNADHKVFYTPSRLLLQLEVALEPNSYRVRFLEDNDRGYDYNIGPDKHAAGSHEIVLVTQKIKEPDWEIK